MSAKWPVFFLGAAMGFAQTANNGCASGGTGAGDGGLFGPGNASGSARQAEGLYEACRFTGGWTYAEYAYRRGLTSYCRAVFVDIPCRYVPRSDLHSNSLFPSGPMNGPANAVTGGALNGTFPGFIVDTPNFVKTVSWGRSGDFATFTGPFASESGVASGSGMVTTHGGTFPATFVVDQFNHTITVTYNDPSSGSPTTYTGEITGLKPINLFSGTSQAEGADPIATGTGEQLLTPGPDLVIPGPFPLAFTRDYSSYRDFLGVGSSVGNNWLHSYAARVFLKNGYASVGLRGGISVYFRQSAGGYQPVTPLNYPAQFVSTANGYRFLDPSLNLIYGFDSGGKLSRLEDRNGNGVDIQQGAAGPTQVSDGLGRALTMSYSGTNMASIKDGSGRLVQLTQDNNGDLTKVVDTDGKTTQYAYTAVGNFSSLMSSMTSPRTFKELTSVSYDSIGQVVQQTDSHGNITNVSYGSSSTTIKDAVGDSTTYQYPTPTVLTAITDGLGNATSLTRDSLNRVTLITDRNGGKTAIAYDAPSGYIASITDPEGNTTKFTYLAQSQDTFTFFVLTKTTYADNTSESYTYDPKGNVLTFTDRAGNVSKYTYNSRGQVLTATNAAGGVTTYTYSSDGSLTSVKLPSGNTTTFAYDPQFRVKQVTFGDGSKRAFSYDNRDNLIKAVDELGQTTAASFDDSGNLVSTTDKLGAQTTLAYDSEEYPIKVTDATGKATTSTYDAADYLKSVTNDAGESATIQRDADKRITSIKDASGKTISFTNDKEGRVSAVTDPLNRTVKYTRDKNGLITRATTPAGENLDVTRDALGRVTSAKDPLGATASFSYDARGLTTSITAPAGITAGFAYDLLGLLNQITDPDGNIWKFTNDAQGRLLSQADPLGNIASYQYDKTDLLAGGTTPLGSFAVTRDAAGRPVQIAFSDGTTLAVTRDAKGRITAADNLALGFDALDRITASNGLAIAYTAAGRIASVTYAPGKTVNYSYTVRGLLDKIADWAGGTVSFAYNDAGQVVSVTRSNGVQTQYGYDANGRVNTIAETGGGSTLASTNITRDATGRITATDQNVPQSNNPVPGVVQLAYDAAEQVAGSTYDGLGRATADAVRNYAWDLASRMTSYAGADGSATATYDDGGLRVSRTDAPGNTLRYAWNYATALPSIATVQSGGSDLRYYVYTPIGGLLYSIESAGGSRHFYHFDQSGSTLLLTDDGGKVTDSYAITPYGESVAHTGTTDTPFTWLGRLGAMQEGSTSLFYLRARYYDSATARFLSRDPLQSVDPREINPYQYADGNPVTRNDATGLKPSNSMLLTSNPFKGRGALTFPFNQGAEITGTGGTIFAVYEVVNADPAAIEQANIPIGVAFISNTTQNIPAPVPVGFFYGQVTGGGALPSALAKQTTTGNVPSGQVLTYTMFGGAGNFAAGLQPVAGSAGYSIAVINFEYYHPDAFHIDVATCNLLFPFVMQTPGCGTGIANR